MRSGLSWFVTLFVVPSVALAQADEAPESGITEQPPATDVGLKSRPPLVAPDEEDQAGRDKDRMETDADARQTPAGHGDTGMVGGHGDSVIQGGGAVLPEGTHAATPIGGGPASAGDVFGFNLEIGGFARAEGLIELFDNDQYDFTFLPRELEIDLLAEHDAGARIRIDLNLMGAPERSVASTFERSDLYDLVEQAFVEWTNHKLTVRAGKMNAPFGVEPLDPVDRIVLSRSTLARLATPDLLTGLYASYDVLPFVSGYLIAVNGWDLTVDGNRSKTLGGGVPHRFRALPGGGYLYEGDLSFIAGPEREGTNDLRWLLDYSATIHLAGGLDLSLEVARGQEDGEGFNKRGMRDGAHAADWWGGMLTVEYADPKADSALLQNLAAGLRIEYVHDHDLKLGLPNRPNLSNLTTLLGFAPTVRYEVVRGIEAVAEYRVDFERGDVENVSVQRNSSNNPFKWFITQEIVFGLLGRF